MLSSYLSFLLFTYIPYPCFLTCLVILARVHFILHIFVICVRKKLNLFSYVWPRPVTWFFKCLKGVQGMEALTCQLVLEPYTLKLFVHNSLKMTEQQEASMDTNNAEPDILQHLTNYFDRKFQEQNENLEQRLTTGSKNLEKRLLEQHKISKTEFKFRGNKIQHQFNSDLIQSLEIIKQLQSCS